MKVEEIKRKTNTTTPRNSSKINLKNRYPKHILYMTARIPCMVQALL